MTSINYDGATRPRKKLGDVFSRLDTIHEYDGQTRTDRQTPVDSNAALI